MAVIQVIHAIPGRLRLKVVPLKNNPSLAQEIQAQIKTLPGISAVEVNPTTGSLLLVFKVSKGQDKRTARFLSVILKTISPGLSVQQVLDWLNPAPPSGQSYSYSNTVASFFQGLNTRVGNALGGLDWKVLLPGALFVLGLRGLIAKNGTPPAWYNLLWFALATFMLFHPAGSRTFGGTEVVHEAVEGMVEAGSGY